MTLKRLFKDEDAVSPVIGVILMVAITVILAAVIGTFVLGLGDQVQQTAPTSSVTFTQDNSGNDATVTITHDSGQALDADNIEILVDGENKTAKDDIEHPAKQWAGDDTKISAGETLEIDADGNADVEMTDLDDATISVIWTSDDGSQSDTLQEYTVS